MGCSGEENRVGITRHMADGGRVTLDWLRPRQSNVKLASSILKEKKTGLLTPMKFQTAVTVKHVIIT
jgi:hypothetical protein